ncbi:MAG: hypothetical protein ACKVU4_02785 [Phycisphaerales bacterium]
MLNHVSKVVLTGALTVSVCAGLARAANEIHVEDWRCATGCGTHSCTTSLHSTTNHNSGANISIVITECTRRINIYADSTSFDIGQVTITHTGSLPPQGVELFIGQGTFPYEMGQSSAAARDLGGISISNASLRQRIWLAGHIAGDQGIVTVGKVYRWDVAGVMNGGISAELSPDAENLFHVYAGSTASVGITAHSGTITLVDIGGNSAAHVGALEEGVVSVMVGGNFTGAIDAGTFITSVIVTGNIGTDGAAVQIATHDSGGSIGVIEAANINANITAGGVNATGDIEQVRTTSATFFKGFVKATDLLGTGEEPALDIAGDVTATLTVHGSVEAPINIGGDLDSNLTVEGSVNAPIDIAGDLDANLTVGESVNAPIDIGDYLQSGNTIKIYLSLDGDASITIGEAAGLEGQIIINADGFDQGSWDGDVRVGAVTLAPTAYVQLPSDLGGGAVGFAGFNFHAWACSPQHEEVLSSPPSSVVVDHYGPV